MMALQLKLRETAQAMVADGKGLLAMDENNPTCNKRFAALDIPQTEEARRAYRELIITTPGLGEFISGAILYDETIHQKTTSGLSFIDALIQTWAVAFSFSRAIQQPALDIWKGQEDNVIAAQKALFHRAECNSAARRGLYNSEMEKV